MSARPTNIIKHKTPGRAFTIIANDILNDSRLRLDEKALLCWFISLPPDWDIVPAHVCKTHNIGRNKYYRLMKALRDAHYAELIIDRAEDGTIVCVRHVISDEPAIPASADGSGIPDQRVREIEDAALEGVGDDTDDPLPQNGEVAPSTSPKSTNGKEASRQSNKDLQNTPPTPQAVPPASRSPPTFRALCAKWPSDRIVTVSAAERRFLRLSEERRQLAIDGVERFLAQTRAKGWKICDLQTYLRDRRWEAVKAGPPAANSVAVPGSPQAERWLAYWEAIGHPTAFARQQLRLGRSITTPTEWPPPLPAQSSDTAKKAS